ncbi:hypothetical protein [Streptomyces sp. x-80]|jgi:pyrimidine deaminase RibD-like protein|uniref:hypothetical protein n=1 Tax=Streptomyces sp. x-80 TaxID=2789282 RepID=UPI00397EA483
MNRYLHLAMKCAIRSQCRYRVGAVVVKGGRILSTACNQHRNLPSIDFHHATFHAEEMALRRAPHVRGAVIYVARVTPAGAAALARPCARCVQGLQRCGIASAWYTTALGPERLRLL